MGLPLIIMTRVPGRAMLERISSNPLSARRLLAQMAQLHVVLHRLPVAACPLSTDRPLIDRQLEAVGQRIARQQLQELSGGFDRLNRFKGIVREEQATLCHGDFHPLNLVVDNSGRLVVLDWSDAALGDRHHDVARTVTLLSFAYIAAQSTFERVLLRTVSGLLRSWYFRPYNRALPVDCRRLHYWEAFHAFRGLLQLYELDFDRPETLGSNPEAVRRLPRSIRHDVRRYFERRMREVERGVPPIGNDDPQTH
jgi:aminoglycoside phosphotransferase (APT) family kinase protein